MVIGFFLVQKHNTKSVECRRQFGRVLYHIHFSLSLDQILSHLNTHNTVSIIITESPQQQLNQLHHNQTTITTASTSYTHTYTHTHTIHTQSIEQFKVDHSFRI